MNNLSKKRSNVVTFALEREINDEICAVLQKRLHVTDKLIERLGLEEELEGHDSCVNCLEWSETGRYLASGSDDTRVIIWDPFRKKILSTYSTFHQGNIFSVKFLPQTNDTKMVTGAADYQVLGLDTVTKEIYFVCNCATQRIKRIATSPDSPDMFWSAAEDGIIRQTDLRVSHRCDPKTDNVLINLRNHTSASAEAKCVAVNPLRTEMVAVGSNDPYIRLYDRRMIKVTSSHDSSDWHRNMTETDMTSSSSNCTESDLTKPWKNTDNLVGGCVQYFVPGHLQAYNGFNTVVTYLTFSPDGRGLLANLGSEQVYLFDVTRKHVPKYFTIPSVLRKTKDTKAVKNPSSLVCTSTNGVISSNSLNDNDKYCKEALPEIIEQIKLKANEYFKNEDYIKAIKTYSDAISKYRSSAVLYGNRAAAYMKREWKGDLYAALRDCRKALQLDPNYVKAFFRLARCFYILKRNEEAKDCLELFKSKFTNHAESHACRALEKDIDSAIKKSLNESSKKNVKNESRTERSLLVSLHLDGIYVADTNSELQASKAENLWRKNASDYERRYCGHCNSTTDIKEANFFGSDGRYIVAGSDDGSIFFWNRETENNIRVLRGDDSIVNCLQPHPTYCLLASSGIDQVVRLWTPMPEDGTVNDRLVKDIDCAAERNNKRMRRDNLIDLMINHSSNSSEESSQMDEASYPCRTS